MADKYSFLAPMIISIVTVISGVVFAGCQGSPQVITPVVEQLPVGDPTIEPLATESVTGYGIQTPILEQLIGEIVWQEGTEIRLFVDEGQVMARVIAGGSFDGTIGPNDVLSSAEQTDQTGKTTYELVVDQNYRGMEETEVGGEQDNIHRADVIDAVNQRLVIINTNLEKVGAKLITANISGLTQFIVTDQETGEETTIGFLGFVPETGQPAVAVASKNEKGEVVVTHYPINSVFARNGTILGIDSSSERAELLWERKVIEAEKTSEVIKAEEQPSVLEHGPVSVETVFDFSDYRESFSAKTSDGRTTITMSYDEKQLNQRGLPYYLESSGFHFVDLDESGNPILDLDGNPVFNDTALADIMVGWFEELRNGNPIVAVDGSLLQALIQQAVAEGQTTGLINTVQQGASALREFDLAFAPRTILFDNTGHPNLDGEGKPTRVIDEIRVYVRGAKPTPNGITPPEARQIPVKGGEGLVTNALVFTGTTEFTSSHSAFLLEESGRTVLILYTINSYLDTLSEFLKDPRFPRVQAESLVIRSLKGVRAASLPLSIVEEQSSSLLGGRAPFLDLYRDLWVTKSERTLMNIITQRMSLFSQPPEGRQPQFWPVELDK